MLILSIYVIESIFIADERIFTEISTILEVAHIVKSLELIFVPHFFLKLHPLSLQLHYLIIVLLPLYL